MNLEDVEQQALNYLAQVTNPVVRIEVLHAHLRDHGLAEGLSLADLKAFLAEHELVRVMDPVIPAQELEALAGGADSDVPSGAYAILATRVPSDAQLAAMMLEQLDAMEQALRAAKTEAADRADMARMGAIDATLNRIKDLRSKLGYHGEAVTTEEVQNGSEDRPRNIIDFPGN